MSKAFGNPDKGSAEVVAVNAVSLDVSNGPFLPIIGPSGCGKSTLLRLIGGMKRGQDMRRANGSGATLKREEELAFDDALETNDSALCRFSATKC